MLGRAVRLCCHLVRQAFATSLSGRRSWPHNESVHKRRILWRATKCARITAAAL